MKNKTLQGVLDEMLTCGVILVSKIDVDAVGLLEQQGIPERLPLIILFATILLPNDINALFEIDEHAIFQLTEDMRVQPVKQASLTKPPEPQSENESNDPDNKMQDSSSALTESDYQTAALLKQPQSLQSVKSDSSLRVHVSLLDTLMTLAGELVLSRNQLVQSVGSDDHHASQIAVQAINLITSELQEAVMQTRMQSVRNVFNKFPRVVRDLAKNLGKQVELTLEGKEVELDKTIIEAIGDPLTHLVRNAIDHGIEMPDDRQRSGKDTTGKIILKAYHEAGQVNIEVSDDGKGLDVNKLVAVAVSKGLITQEQARAMSDKEKAHLIFMPGFSTAEKITDVSGRGVGMDVVKTNLDKLGGVVEIDSEFGKGTAIRIKLPLTLAIIPCQIIVTGSERYAIPQVNLEELLRIAPGQIKDKIERVGDAEVVRLRGDLLPLVYLSDVIGVERTYYDSHAQMLKKERRMNIADRRSPKSPLFSDNLDDEKQLIANDPETAISNASFEQSDGKQIDRNPQDRRYHSASALNIVVVSTGAMKYGLIVDRLIDSEEIVVKPLGRHLKHCEGYAGATIMGDGRVALILDVGNIARMAGLNSLEGTTRAAEIAKEINDAIRASRDKQSLLLFRSAEDEQFAVSLNQVQRIEKIQRAAIEEIGNKRVIQYRGGSLPLLRIDDVAQVKPLTDKDSLLAIVFELAGREIGLLATGPVDALDISDEVDEHTLKQTGILGSLIINNRTTMLVDIFGLVQALHAEWFEKQNLPMANNVKNSSILYAEDSNFFRNQVKNFMEGEGYNVIEAEDGVIAWDLLQQYPEKISLVVTDIEMPNLDGYGLAEKIRNDNRFAELPIIAVTTLAGDEDIAKGKSVGINEYQIKLDREKLLSSLQHFMQTK